MAYRTRTEYINDMFVSTYDRSIGGLRDQVFDPYSSVFWATLRMKGGLQKKLGGTKVKYDLEVGKNEQIYWLKKGGATELHDFDILDQARYGWYRASKPIVRWWADDQENAGDAEIYDTIKRKITNTMNSWREDLDSHLLGANDESGTTVANAPPGIQHLISTDGTGTVGEIDAATYTWWKNQFINYQGTTDYVTTINSPTAADFLSTGQSAMREMVKLCMGKTSLIFTTWGMYKLLQADLMSYYQWYGQQPADLGILVKTLYWEGIPIVWGSNCPGGQMYFLDMDGLKFTYDPRYFFKLGQWMAIPDQPEDMVVHTLLACSFGLSSRRTQGLIHGLPV
jgi:hypothetical protein